MSSTVKKVYNNFREYINKNLNYNLDSNFKIQNQETLCEDDRISFDWLKNIKVYNCEYTSFNEKVVLFKYLTTDSDEDKRRSIGSYILFSSYENKHLKGNIQGFAKEVDLDLGMFIHMFSKVEYAPLINLDLSRDIIEDVLEAEIYTFNQIKKLFSNIIVFKIDNKYINGEYEVEGYSDWIYRFLGILKCRNKIENIKKEIYFSEECIEEYIKVFSEDIKYFPYENLYLSLNHNSPKHIFLDLYRIIEKLYPIIFCVKLKKDMNILGIELFDIHKKLKTQLNWNHKEADAIKEIFIYAETIVADNVANINILKESIDLKYKDMKIDNWIYQIRNTCVHLSFNDEKKIDVHRCLNNDILIKNLIPIVSELYKNLFI